MLLLQAMLNQGNKTCFVSSSDKGKKVMNKIEPKINELQVLNKPIPKMSKSKVVKNSESNIQKSKVLKNPKPKNSKSKVLKKVESKTFGPKTLKGVDVKTYSRQDFYKQKFWNEYRPSYQKKDQNKRKPIKSNKTGPIRVWVPKSQIVFLQVCLRG